VRATLHDELMREAGFESEYDRKLARQRDRRRRLGRLALSMTFPLAMFLVTVAIGLGLLGLGERLLGLLTLGGAGAGLLIDFVKRWRKAR